MSSQQEAGATAAAAAWSLADDVFAARYQAGLSHTEGAWQPLPQASLQLEPPPRPPGAAPPPPAAARRHNHAAGAAQAPQHEPWLLAAGAYAREAGGWTLAAKSARARALFQYKPYSQQEPLEATEAEVAAVVEAVFGRPAGQGGPAAFQGEAESLWDSLAGGAAFGLAAGATTTGEVAAVVLIKLVMDLYVKAGAQAAFPLALLLLQKPLLGGEPAAQARVFDLLYNLSVHGELLYDSAAAALPEDAPALADAVSELEEGDGSAAALSWRATVTSAFRASLAATIRAAGPPQAAGNPRGSLDGSTRLGRAAAGRASVDGRGGLRPNGGVPGAAAAAEWPPLLGQRPAARCPAAERFQQWLRLLLFQLLAALAASGTAAEGPWVAALSCLLHLGTHDGRAVRAYLEGLPLSVVAALLEQCRRHRWSEQLHAWLVGLAANLLYRHADEGGEGGYGPHALRGSGSESLRSGGGGSVGAGNRGSHGGGDGAPSWWAGSQLDPERLAAFGGLRAVLRCYRAAPCALARRSMFAVLYDRVVSGQKPAPEDAWAPVLLQAPHSSESLALGAALLRMGAAEAVHPLFLAGVGGAMQHLADAVSLQMAALQAANPGRVVAVPGSLVAECMECLEEMATADMQVPAALQEPLKLTLEAVGAPDTAPSSLSAADASAVWGCLADCMRDPSLLGSRAGRGWLLQLLVAAAERELARSGGTPPPPDTPAPQQQQRDGDDGAAAAAAPASPPPLPPALLPEVAPHGGCQLQPGRRGLQGQAALRELLLRALATTPDSQAADSFMAAVASLLAHVRLRCATAAWEQSDEWGGGAVAGSSASAGTPAPGGGATPVSSLRQPGSAARLRSQDSIAEAEVAAARAESVTSGAQSSPFDGPASGWRALNCPEAIISTLSLAVEWLLQAPPEARQGAMLHATELLLAFTLAPLDGAGSGGSYAGGAAALEGAEAADAAPPATPLVSPAVSGVRAGGGAQHRLAAAAPSLLQLPPSPASSPLGPLSPGLPGLPQRPLSPSMMALQAAAAAAVSGGGGGAAAAAAQQQQQQQERQQERQERPGTPRASSFDRLQGAGEPSAADVALSAGFALAPAAQGPGSSSEQLEAAAAAAAEAQATRLWSFLSGRAMVPQGLLRLLPPLLLRTLFEELRPDAAALHYDALATAGAGAPASRLAKAADAALGVKAAVQADRPLWDARAAVLLLLMARAAGDGGALAALGGAAFFTGLLGEADARVRHYASVFVLRELQLQHPLQYRRALRGVVARAQAANDERLLSNPHLQLRAMLEIGRVQLEAL